MSPLNALEANMKNKHLVKLDLKLKLEPHPYDPRKEKEVLQNLHPSNH